MSTFQSLHTGCQDDHAHAASLLSSLTWSDSTPSTQHVKTTTTDYLGLTLEMTKTTRQHRPHPTDHNRPTTHPAVSKEKTHPTVSKEQGEARRRRRRRRVGHHSLLASFSPRVNSKIYSCNGKNVKPQWLMKCKNRKYKNRIESHIYKQIEKLMKHVHHIFK